jgi:signal transduction histidine kinase
MASLGMLQHKDTSLDRSQRFYVATISSSGSSLIAVINGFILDYARIESGKLSLEHIDFDLEGLISDTLQPVHWASGHWINACTSTSAWRMAYPAPF